MRLDDAAERRKKKEAEKGRDKEEWMTKRMKIA